MGKLCISTLLCFLLHQPHSKKGCCEFFFYSPSHTLLLVWTFYSIGIIYICKAQTAHLMDLFHHGAYFTNLMHDGIHLNDEVIDQSSPIFPQVDSTTKKQRGGNFTSEEDIMIISAWINISLDVVQGNEQKSKTYCEYFHEYKPKSCPIRSQNSLMNRWSAIQIATNKFCGCFAQIERLNQSGLTEKDKV